MNSKKKAQRRIRLTGKTTVNDKQMSNRKFVIYSKKQKKKKKNEDDGQVFEDRLGGGIPCRQKFAAGPKDSLTDSLPFSRVLTRLFSACLPLPFSHPISSLLLPFLSLPAPRFLVSFRDTGNNLLVFFALFSIQKTLFRRPVDRK